MQRNGVTFIYIHGTSVLLMVALHGIYQDAQPSMIIQLWKANLEEPNFNQPDPAAIIYDSSKSKFSNLLSIMIVYVNAVYVIYCLVDD